MPHYNDFTGIGDCQINKHHTNFAIALKRTCHNRQKQDKTKQTLMFILSQIPQFVGSA